MSEKNRVTSSLAGGASAGADMAARGRNAEGRDWGIEPDVYCEINKVDNDFYSSVGTCLAELEDKCGDRTPPPRGRGTGCSACIANHSDALKRAGCTDRDRELFCETGDISIVCGQPEAGKTECPDNPEYCIFNDNGVCDNPAAETKVDCLKLNGEWKPNNQGYCERNYIRMYKRHNELCDSSTYLEQVLLPNPLPSECDKVVLDGNPTTCTDVKTTPGPEGVSCVYTPEQPGQAHNETVPELCRAPHILGGGLDPADTIPICLNKKIDDYCRSLSNDADIGLCNESKYCTVIPNLPDTMLSDFKSENLLHGPPDDKNHVQMEKYCWNKDVHECEISVGTCKWDTTSKSCYYNTDLGPPGPEIWNEGPPRTCISNCFQHNNEGDCDSDIACNFDPLIKQCIDTNINICRPSLNKCVLSDDPSCDTHLSSLNLAQIKRYLPGIKSFILLFADHIPIVKEVVSELAQIFYQYWSRKISVMQMTKEIMIYLAAAGVNEDARDRVRDGLIDSVEKIGMELIEVNASIVRGICLPKKSTGKKFGNDSCNDDIDCYSGYCREGKCDNEYYTLKNVTQYDCLRNTWHGARPEGASPLRDWIVIPSSEWSDINSASSSEGYFPQPAPDKCTAALESVCAAERSSNCLVCAGEQQEQLRAAGCSNYDIQAWCDPASAPAQSLPLCRQPGFRTMIVGDTNRSRATTFGKAHSDSFSGDWGTIFGVDDADRICENVLDTTMFYNSDRSQLCADDCSKCYQVTPTGRVGQNDGYTCKDVNGPGQRKCAKDKPCDPGDRQWW